jgi:hypothetical protein
MGNFPRFLEHLECDVSHGDDHYEANVTTLMSMTIDGCQSHKKCHVGHLNSIALSSSIWHVLAMPFSLHSLSWLFFN